MSPSPSMVCPCIILVSLLTCCPPVAGNKVTTYNITAQIGSSVLLPGPDIEINENMYLELKKPGGHPDWLAFFHGLPTVHDNYTTRGEYLQNGSFILRNLTKEDSGEYLQEVNTKLLARINLIALAPVKQPELHKQDLHNKQCEVVLNCTGSGEGRLNTTLLHGEKVITTQNGNALVVSVSSRLTESQGSYMCTLANPVSEKTSPFVEIQYPVSIWVLVVLHWSCFVLVHACLSLLFIFILPQLVNSASHNSK
ncbi:uncharacterized protein LOC128647591 [Bombina bombina]|uniref:uncharacterized protein LOC128647591 n=1 Tax=Bombina bombina TaxID=8345 RepID=UPI00235A4D6E|nr:uncharacterized protein LOC128647591 [Bombina bombina]